MWGPPTAKRSSGLIRLANWLATTGSPSERSERLAKWSSGATRRSAMLGTSTSAAEITNISKHGVWLLLDDRELFMPFDEFPWFAKATVQSILNVERPQPEHLYWPDLDVDLHV